MRPEAGDEHKPTRGLTDGIYHNHHERWEPN